MRNLAKVKRKKSKGFTLIELLVVVAIIGILAAIAIPQFAAYRQRAFNARAQSDVRNTMTAQEAYFVDNETYAATWAALNSGSVGATKSQGVSLNSVGTATGFTVDGCHSAG